jgi:hypothetical protein
MTYEPEFETWWESKKIEGSIGTITFKEISYKGWLAGRDAQEAMTVKQMRRLSGWKD